MERGIRTWCAQGAQLLLPPTVDPIQNVSCALLIYRGAVPIELVAPLPDGPNPVAGRLSKGGGLDHVCLFTENLDSDLNSLVIEGGIVAVEPCYGAVFNRQLAFVLTRSGLIVELMTRKIVHGHGDHDPLEGFLSSIAY